MEENQYLNMRRFLVEREKELVSTLPPLDPSLEEFYSSVETADRTASIDIKVIRPKLPASSRPLVLLFHGGGFVMGTPEMLTRPGREIALDFDAVVVLSSYRKAPEHPFPRPITDGWHIARHICEHPFGADPQAGFVIGGFSAGGHLAAVLAAQNAIKGEPLPFPITGSFLCIPSIMSDSIVPQKYKPLWTSRIENDGKTLLSSQMMGDLDQLFDPDHASTWYSPVNCMESLDKVPATYIQVGGLDLVRDDGVVYYHMLRDVGVPVRMDLHEQLGHDGFTVWAQGETSPLELKTKTMQGMAWLLRRTYQAGGGRSLA